MDHFHSICGVLVILLSALLVVATVRSRIWMRRAGRERRRYADDTHAARVAVVGEISAAIVHEVTQPLSSILNNVQAAEMLLRAPNANVHDILEILTDVRQEDLRAHKIINALRSFLRKRELTPERCDINALIEGVLILVRPDAVRRGVVIHTSLDSSAPTLVADPVHMQQVLLNLIVNGMEAMQDTDPAERRLEIRTAVQADGMLRVEVRDQGGGVSPGDKARLFEPFFTTKAQGMGLGLSLARSIVALHGGSIWLSDDASRGATFVVTLPVSGAFFSTVRRTGTCRSTDQRGFDGSDHLVGRAGLYQHGFEE